MSNTPDRPRSLDDLPQARVEHSRKSWFFWLVPIAAAVLAGWFIYSDMFRGGPTLHLSFENAAGLQAGKSQLKYRGAEVGEVRDVKLAKDHQRVEITAVLKKSAESLAREGSRFWIVRAEVGAEAIRGLRTIVSGDYIAVAPGGGKRETKFTGLEEEPILEPGGVLKVVLLTERSGSLRKRSPIFYRGVQVGEVFDTRLGPESQTIHIDVHIKRHFAPLVRTNSKFWNAGGINFNISLSGADITAQSAETLISGGVDFATPDTTQPEAPEGTAFRLYDKPADQWLSWAPAIRLEPEKHPPEQASNLRP